MKSTDKLKNIRRIIEIIALVAVIGFSMVTCEDGNGKNNDLPPPPNGVPTASDFTIVGATTAYFDGTQKAVTVTPKTGKTTGDVTVYYEGIGGTQYSKMEYAPVDIGRYTVTFEVTASQGWDKKTDLYAGVLEISNGTPAVPSGLGASITSSTSINVSWSAVTRATSYNVFYIAEGGDALLKAGTATGTTSFTHTGLTANTVYWYYVTAVNSYGESVYSAYKAVKLGVPDTPATVEAVAISSSKVSLRWSSVTGASSYTIYYTANNETNTKVKLGTVTGTSQTTNNGQANTNYYFFITAVNAIGESDFSTVASAKTFASDKPDAPINLRLTGASGNAIEIRWDPLTNDGDYNYNVWVSLESSPTTKYGLIHGQENKSTGLFAIYDQYLYSDSSKRTICSIYGLTSNTTYYFYVNAEVKSSNVMGYFSQALVIKTGAPVPPPPLPSTPSSVPSSPPAAASAGQMLCPNCHGSGDCQADYMGSRCRGGTVTCWICYGSGTVTKGSKKETCSACNGRKEVTCKSCSGSGKCTVCNGKGKV
ncbi:fibronectin type III domain-containing protein [Treponema sp. R80B11-R83G3]